MRNFPEMRVFLLVPPMPCGVKLVKASTSAMLVPPVPCGVSAFPVIVVLRY